jgi:MFS transporter, Spinster family, sphingosine-1-phosphate transporter
MPHVAKTQPNGGLVHPDEDNSPHGVDPDRQFPARGTVARAPRRMLVIRSASLVFWLMFAINAVNYLDRFLAVAVGPVIKSEFSLRDADIGTLASAFLLVYTLTAVPIGLLADRVSRARVVSAGLAVWSLASAATAFARGFSGLFASRAAVGVGEASYYPAGTAMLSAYFPLKVRARVMSRWSAGQLVGMALAFALSAFFIHLLGPALGWRVAFLVAGPPGLVLATLLWVTEDGPTAPTAPAAPAARAPVPTARTWLSEETPQEATTGVAATSASSATPTAWQRIAIVARIRTVWLVIALQALLFIIVTPAVTFLPIYLRSDRGPFHVSNSHATILAGAMIVIGGTCGALLGGTLADALAHRSAGSRILVQDVTPAALRGTAVAVTLMCSHLFGDVWSPRVVGVISTSLHERSGTALLIVGVPALAIASLVGLLGARIHAREVARQTPDDIAAGDMLAAARSSMQ